MSWNYRIVRDLDGSVGLCEVYYADGVPGSWSEPEVLVGTTPKDIKDDMVLMMKAFDLPVLRAINMPQVKGVQEQHFILEEESEQRTSLE